MLIGYCDLLIRKDKYFHNGFLHPEMKNKLEEISYKARMNLPISKEVNVIS